MEFILQWPVVPNRGLRGIDAWGAGGFNAPRRKGSTRYGHKGLDFQAKPGDAVVFPLAGSVIHLGRAYPDEAPNVRDPSDLSSIHIRCRGELRRLRAKILYAAPVVALGAIGEAGTPLGVAEDRSAYAAAQNPAKGPMINHIHLELWWEDGDAVLVDPTPHLETTT